MATRMSEQQMRQRAIEKAVAHRGAAVVRRVRYGRYEVESGTRAGTFHTVTHDDAGRWACTCEAGARGLPCWHQALIYIAKIEAGGGRVVAPAVAVELPAALPANVVSISTLRPTTVRHPRMQVAL